MPPLLRHSRVELCEPVEHHPILDRSACGPPDAARHEHALAALRCRVAEAPVTVGEIEDERRLAQGRRVAAADGDRHQAVARRIEQLLTVTAPDWWTKREVVRGYGNARVIDIGEGAQEEAPRAPFAFLSGEPAAIRPGIPAQFYALSRGDYASLKGRAEGLYNSLNGFGGNASSMAFGCSGNISAERRAQVAREAKQTIVGDASGRKKEFCEAVGALDPGAKFRAKIQSKIPVLFVSGTLDGTTPASQADELRRGFPNSVHLLIENGGHEVLPDTNVQAVVVGFFKGQDVSQRSVKFDPPKFAPLETQR